MLYVWITNQYEPNELMIVNMKFIFLKLVEYYYEYYKGQHDDVDSNLIKPSERL